MNHLCMPSFSLIVSSIAVEVGSFEMELLRCDRASGTGCRVEKRFSYEIPFCGCGLCVQDIRHHGDNIVEKN